MTTQTFTLSECTIEDIPGMIHVYNTSFENDYFGQFIFPRDGITPEEKHRWLTARFSSYMKKREIRTFKMVEDSTGHLAAFLRWTFPHVLTEEEKKEQERENLERERVRREEGIDINWPRGSNLELCDEKFGGLERLKEKYVDEKEMYIAQLLGTDPAYQRKGLASRLLKHVLDMADKEGRKVYIEATAAGHPVYWKLGFRDIDIIQVDLTKWGGKEGINRIMMREPQAVS